MAKAETKVQVIAKVNLTFGGHHRKAGATLAMTKAQAKEIGSAKVALVRATAAPANDGGEVEIPVGDPVPPIDPGVDLDAPPMGQE